MSLHLLKGVLKSFYQLSFGVIEQAEPVERPCHCHIQEFYINFRILEFFAIDNYYGIEFKTF